MAWTVTQSLLSAEGQGSKLTSTDWEWDVKARRECVPEAQSP